MDNSILLALKAAAAVLAKTADDYEKNRLWEGELTKAVGQVVNMLSSIRE